MDFEKLLEQEARKAARQDYEEVTEKTKDYSYKYSKAFIQKMNAMIREEKRKAKKKRRWHILLVAENFSRTAPTWGWFAFYAVMSFLVIFLVWDDDYILSEDGIICRRMIFTRKYTWDDFPYCGICYKEGEEPEDKKEKFLYFSKKPKSHRKFEKVCKRIEYTSEVEAIFQIYCPYMDKPDWEFWNEELKETRVWNEEDFRTYKREVFKKDIIQSVYFLPVLWVLKFIDNYYIPVILMGITVFIYCSSYADKWASRIKDLTKEYQRAALRQLIDEKQKVYIKTESIEG